MRNFVAFLCIFLICLLTLNLWLFSKQDIGLLTKQPLRSLSQVFALWGIVLLSLTLLLSIRFRFWEYIFGGLDKVYWVHHFLGSVAFILLINHPLLLAIQALPQVKLSLIYLIPSSDIAYTLGVLGIYAMIASLIFIVFIKLPYHIWKWVHKLLGIAFLLGSVHVLLISSDTSSYLPLSIWIYGFLLLGTIAVLYTVFLSSPGRRYKYEVLHIERVSDIVTLFLSPTSKPLLKFNPGQFVYVKFENKNLGNEYHPFSIASAPQENILKLSAKIVGDYTLKLPYINSGDKAIVSGPFGNFGISPKFNQNSNSLWIAGGIGVTPFLSMLASQIYLPSFGLINFFYTYRQKEEGVFKNQIYNLLQRISYVRFFDWCSTEKKRLSVEQIKNVVDLSKIDSIFLCGPLPMMEDLNKQFIKYGIPKNKIIYENFSFL